MDDLWLLALLLALFVLLVVGRDFGLSFVGDDFIFLDKTRSASFAKLWSPVTSVDFGWYRPWSRELHFWLVQRMFGVDAAAFRLINAALWVAMLCLYASILRRLASSRVAAIATLGVAALAFWGTPLLWVCGSQDLWMLVFTLLGFLLFLRGRAAWALGAFVLALLSKETAGILPALLCAYLVITGRRSLAQAARQTWAFWSVLGVWAVLHPTLRLRFLSRYVSADELQSRPPWFAIPLKNAAACFNLDRIPHPQELTAGVVIGAVLAALLLAVGAVLAARKHPLEVRDPDREALARLAGAWALIGWTPVLLPSVGWHAYYGCVGALGLWFGVALWLQSRPRVAFAVIATVALLRGAQACRRPPISACF